jgi:hypothetical protein
MLLGCWGKLNFIHCVESGKQVAHLVTLKMEMKYVGEMREREERMREGRGKNAYGIR